MKKLAFLLTFSFFLASCQNQAPPTVTAPSSTTTTANSTNTVTLKPETDNGIPIYNGFIEADTTGVASGNKYVIDVVKYELYNQYLFLDKNYEVCATQKPDTLQFGELGEFHPYLLRVFVMPKPAGFQNVQVVQLSFSNEGVPFTHRTEYLPARLEGWNQQLSTKKNFKSCTTDDIRCKAERVLESLVGIMFR